MTSQESNLLLQENTFRLLQERESQTLGNSTTAELELQRQILHLQQELAKATQGNVPSEIRQDVSHSGGSSASGTNSSSLTSPSPVNTTPGLELSNKEELRDKQEEYYLSSELLNVKNINDLIKNGIKKSVWPVCKALIGDASELEKPDFVSCNFKNAEGKYPEPSQVVQVVDLLFEYMGYDKTDLKKKVLFWKTYKSMVKRELSDFRTTTVGLIRKSFLKHYKEWKAADEASEDSEEMDEENEMPQYSDCFGKQDMGEFLACCRKFTEKGLSTRIAFRDLLRTEITEEGKKKVYKVLDIFFSVFLGNAYRFQYFGSQKLVKTVSAFTTVSDEAFALAVLENYLEVWIVDFENKSREKEDRLRQYQRLSPENPESSYHKKMVNRKNLFSIDFVHAYNEYMVSVNDDRDCDESKKFEKMFRDAYRRINRKNLQKKGGKKRKASEIAVAMPKLVTNIAYVPVNIVDKEKNNAVGEDEYSRVSSV